jgi:hypothetical protein
LLQLKLPELPNFALVSQSSSSNVVLKTKTCSEPYSKRAIESVTGGKWVFCEEYAMRRSLVLDVFVLFFENPKDIWILPTAALNFSVTIPLYAL